jgi:hypothetical protein
LDDNYTEVVADRQTVDGMTDADTAAVQKPYE